MGAGERPHGRVRCRSAASAGHGVARDKFEFRDLARLSPAARAMADSDSDDDGPHYDLLPKVRRHARSNKSDASAQRRITDRPVTTSDAVTLRTDSAAASEGETEDARSEDQAFINDAPSPIARSSGSPDGDALDLLGPVLPPSERRDRLPVEVTPMHAAVYEDDVSDEDEDVRYRPLVFRRTGGHSDDEGVPRIEAKFASRHRALWATPQTAFAELDTIARARRSNKGPLVRRPVSAYRERFAVDWSDFELPPAKRRRLAAPGHRASHAKTPRRDGAGLVDVFSGLAPARSVPRIVVRGKATAVKRPRRLKPGQRTPPVLDFGVRPREEKPPETPAPRRRPNKPAPEFSFGGRRSVKKVVQPMTPPEEPVEERPDEADIDWEPPRPPSAAEEPVDLDACAFGPDVGRADWCSAQERLRGRSADPRPSVRPPARRLSRARPRLVARPAVIAGPLENAAAGPSRPRAADARVDRGLDARGDGGR